MAEEKKNRSEELESLDKKINEIINGWNQNPEEIVEFLQFSSKFSYAYSPRNMMLIAQQQRGALLCKSFRQNTKFILLQLYRIPLLSQH